MGRLTVSTVVAAWAIPIAALVGSIVPEPYMDEIFHVPQAQQYCRGDFLTWDPMITTPPGLYYASVVYVSSLFPGAWTIRLAETFDVLCSTAILRSTNVIMAMFGAFSILFRQTNVIWMTFFAANGAISYVQDIYLKNNVSREKSESTCKSYKVVSHNDNQISSQGLRRRRINSPIAKNEVASESSELCNSLTEEVWDISLKLWNSKCEVLIAFTPFAIVMVSFIAFIIWNGGIVLGAKEAHVVSLHFAQFLYFSLVSAAALLPWHFTPSQILDLFCWLGKNKTCSSLSVLVALGLSIIAVHFFSIAHPYLLADNRHYTFYIWRKVIQVNWMMKYILIPLYVYSWFSIINILGKSQSRVWVLSYILSVALVLVPPPLVEFRYYTIPFIILILHSPMIGNGKLFALGSLYVAANLFTMAMFMFQPFHWEHESGTQRFMW